jgi:hypothetical protein
MTRADLGLLTSRERPELKYLFASFETSRLKTFIFLFKKHWYVALMVSFREHYLHTICIIRYVNLKRAESCTSELPLKVIFRGEIGLVRCQLLTEPICFPTIHFSLQPAIDMYLIQAEAIMTKAHLVPSGSRVECLNQQHDPYNIKIQLWKVNFL